MITLSINEIWLVLDADLSKSIPEKEVLKVSIVWDIHGLVVKTQPYANKPR